MSLGRLRQVFYGWWIVAAGFMIQLLVGALLNQAYGAYVVLLQKDFGWTKTMLSGAYSLTRVESGLLGPLQGWLMDRLGPQALMRVGMLMFGGGFIGFSLIGSATEFYVAFLLMALGSSLAGFFPLTVAVVNWFERRRATALALMSTGFAVGGLLVPVVVLSMDQFGWRATAFASGVLIIVAGLPLVQMVRFRPEHYGLTVDGDPPRPSRTPSATLEAPAAEPADYDAGQALRTPAFWLISLGHASALLVVGAVMVHLVSHLHDNLGYSLTAAALVVTLMTAMQVLGQLLGGFLGDRFEKRLIATACMAMHAAGLLVVAYATATWMAIAFAVLHGLAWGTRGPLMQAMRADYFGRRSFGTIMGFSSLIVMLGQVSGPLIAGVLADRTGSYESGFTILAGMAAFGSVFFILATKPRAKAAAAAPPVREAAGVPGD
jgi:MFS family permease